MGRRFWSSRWGIARRCGRWVQTLESCEDVGVVGVCDGVQLLHGAPGAGELSDAGELFSLGGAGFAGITRGWHGARRCCWWLEQVLPRVHLLQLSRGEQVKPSLRQRIAGQAAVPAACKEELWECETQLPCSSTAYPVGVALVGLWGRHEDANDLAEEGRELAAVGLASLEGGRGVAWREDGVPIEGVEHVVEDRRLLPCIRRWGLVEEVDGLGSALRWLRCC